MYNVLAVSGSLRTGSANTGLIRMAERLAPPELAIEQYLGIDALPYYNPDIDLPDALPDAVVQWRAAVTATDAILLAAPEYNYGPSGVLKNAIDWATRPLGTHSIQGKAIAVVTSGGGGGGKRVQASLIAILEILGNTVVNDPEIAVIKGSAVISPDGTTTDPDLEGLMAARLANLVAALDVRAAAAPAP